jgi:hypothetical protein
MSFGNDRGGVAKVNQSDRWAALEVVRRFVPGDLPAR